MIDSDATLTREERKVGLRNHIKLYKIIKLITFLFADKSSAETTSDSDDGRHA